LLAERAKSQKRAGSEGLIEDEPRIFRWSVSVQDDKGTILDSTATFEGKMVGSTITVQGRFKGDLEASGVLRIVEGSDIEATIKAARVEISGTFHGEVQTESLQLLEKGRASGTFRAKKLSVREGAKLNGELEVGDTAGAGSTSG
jgi:cytoskeletal protein CcmA (bactofilin family)